MQKRHFEMIARHIRVWTIDDKIDRDQFIASLCNEFQAANPNFDRSRFIAACNGEDSHDSAGRKVHYSTDPNAGMRN